MESCNNINFILESEQCNEADLFLENKEAAGCTYMTYTKELKECINSNNEIVQYYHCEQTSRQPNPNNLSGNA